MCSIMGFTSKRRTLDEIRPFFDKTKSRGPDVSRMEETPSGYLCFHRLAIMGLTPEGMQPFHLDGDMCVCNGELYGFRSLKEKLSEKYAFQSDSDCELLLPLYREIFEKYYPGQAEMVQDFWMPNKEWAGCDVNDPSARVLSNYGGSGI